MKVVMLDTNVVIDIFRNRTAAFEKLKEFNGYTFLISHLVCVEFMVGMQIREKKDGRKFLNEFVIKTYNEAAQKQANKYTDIYFVGRENKPIDLMIAAHAKALKLPIITNNAKDFIFTGLKVYHYSKSFWI
ncbi:MAG: type II toxin-antitoxin system VapC family toxin [Chitinophagaceae bacterium]|nr:type II toxin-antitoxin system VapC family toxin [Chitinophagaceae bacterium]MCW5905358.1 type II toxin-antitoxin system VapC family toxin [Chitinophagaceae bacterium]